MTEIEKLKHLIELEGARLKAIGNQIVTSKKYCDNNEEIGSEILEKFKANIIVQDMLNQTHNQLVRDYENAIKNIYNLENQLKENDNTK